MIWNVLHNISLLLFTAGVAMWVRSYEIGDRYTGWSRRDSAEGTRLVATRFACGHGQISLERMNIQYARDAPPSAFSIEPVSSLFQREAGWQHEGSAVGVDVPTVFRSPQFQRGGTQLWQLGFPHY